MLKYKKGVIYVILFYIFELGQQQRYSLKHIIMKKVNLSLELIAKVVVFGLLTLAAAKVVCDAVINGSNIL